MGNNTKSNHPPPSLKEEMFGGGGGFRYALSTVDLSTQLSTTKISMSFNIKCQIHMSPHLLFILSPTVDLFGK
jgi:hypothetical protein